MELKNPETNTLMHTNTSTNVWHIHSIILCSLKFTFSLLSVLYDVVVDTFPRHFIFLIPRFSFFLSLCVEIHLCRIFSSHASLIFFSFFCISHHIIVEKRMKNMSKLTEKEEQIKSNIAKNEKENFSSYFSLFC